MDIFENLPGLGYIATVTFADETVVDYDLPISDIFDPPVFWGITADQLIEAIHFGGPGGSSRTDGSFLIDDLTIGETSLILADGFESGDTSAWN